MIIQESNAELGSMGIKEKNSLRGNISVYRLPDL